MPITPLHMGPALAVKALAPRHFSFLVFCVTQVIIDTEAAFHLLVGEPPLHRFLHTYLGATIVAVITVVVGRPLLEMAIWLWNRLMARSGGGLMRIGPSISLTAAVSGALLGSYSHVLLDSIIYEDIKPFAPWTDSNIMLNALSTGDVYLLCLSLGGLGAVTLVAVRVMRAVRRRHPRTR